MYMYVCTLVCVHARVRDMIEVSYYCVRERETTSIIIIHVSGREIVGSLLLLVQHMVACV